MIRIVLIATCFIVFFACSNKAGTINIYVDEAVKEDVDYALQELTQELKANKIDFSFLKSKEHAHLVVETKERINKKNDGFKLEKDNETLLLSSGNTRGLLYGLLDIAEQIKIKKNWGTIKVKSVSAHYPFRAIKLNLPWFPYRGGENLSLHYDTCKDLKFWEAFLDMMVANKFNTLTLWNLHPFMYMVQSDKFPEASPFTKEEMAEWQTFWKAIFKMAKARGIDPYIFNWNIFVSEEFGKAYNVAEYSKDGGYWGDGETNAIIEEYTREMVSKTINEYEDLVGIGITLGERMGGMTSEIRRDWIDRTLIQGIKDADRKVKLFYRAPLSAGTTSHGTVSKATEVITREAIENIGLDDEVLLGFKFNWSHGHSSPKLSIVHGGILTDTYWKPEPANYKGVYTVRNEDFFVLRWGQPDFVRDFMKYNSEDYINGVIIGSETYIPAKDYTTKETYRTWDYAFQKQWLFYKTWGNLLYNKETPDTYFADVLANKYGITDGSKLVSAWRMASQNANSLASFYRGEWDGTLYTEGMTREKGQFIGVNKVISHPVLDSSYVNIANYVKGAFTEDQITPLQFADAMEEKSIMAQKIAKQIIKEYPEKELLKIETNDIDTWGHFGLYIADKVRGGVALQTYRVKGDKQAQKEAISHLTNALQHWKDYVTSIEKYNVEVMPHQFNNKFSFREHIAGAERDIAIAKQEIN
ncbi:hypothetical protein [Flavivirga eckloniae]|nr:hypothetical protein [Flavivirga eckloniae]